MTHRYEYLMCGALLFLVETGGKFAGEANLFGGPNEIRSTQTEVCEDMTHAKRVSAALLAALLVLAGCGGTKPATETKKEEAPASAAPAPAPAPAPKVEKLTIGFVPSSDAAGIEDKVKPMSDYLAKELGIPVDTFVGTNFVGVIEAMGSGKVDVGFLNPLAYVLANADYGVQPILKTSRKGSVQYRAQLTVRAGENIPVCDQAKDPSCKATFEALKGKKMAFVDPASTSGYLYPASLLKNAGISVEKGAYFSDAIFAGSHDNAVKAVYNKTVDAAWSFEDARDNILKEFTDAKEKLQVVAYTEWIPNDTVSVRKDLPADINKKLADALKKYVATEEGKALLTSLYTIDGFVDGSDADYKPVVDMAKNMNVDIKAELTKPKK